MVRISSYRRGGGPWIMRRAYSKAGRSYATRKASSLPRKYRGRFRRAGLWGRFQGPDKELKYFDQAVAATGIGTGGVFYDGLVTVANGTGPSNRIGQKITVKKLMIRAELKNIPATDPNHTSDRVRLIVVQDTQSNGSVPTAAADILTNPTDGKLINAFNNMSNSKRFKTLYDKTHTLNTGIGAPYAHNAGWSVPAAASGTQAGYSVPADTVAFTSGEYTKQVNIYLNNLHIPLEYFGTTGAYTEIKTNNLFMFAVSAESHTQMSVTWRARYSD